MSTILELVDVNVTRNQKTVLHISELGIKTGQLVNVIGANGAGKSTLLQTLNLLLPYQGTMKLFGQVVTETSMLPLRRRSGMVFQDPLFYSASVFDNVALPLQFRGVPRREISQRVGMALDLFRCSHLANRIAHNLSGGEMQRVCLARAFVTEPELLLLDEPFHALDPWTRHSLLHELKLAMEEKEMTALFVSHTIDEIMQFGHRTIVLCDGEIVQDDDSATILRVPANYQTARLIGMDNIFPCTVVSEGEGSMITLENGIRFYYPGAAAGKRYCCMAGDIFSLTDTEESAESGSMTLTGVIRHIAPGIGVDKIIIDICGLPFALRVPRDMAGLVINKHIRIVFKPTDVTLVD